MGGVSHSPSHTQQKLPRVRLRMIEPVVRVRMTEPVVRLTMIEPVVRPMMAGPVVRLRMIGPVVRLRMIEREVRLPMAGPVLRRRRAPGWRPWEWSSKCSRWGLRSSQGRHPLGLPALGSSHGRHPLGSFCCVWLVSPHLARPGPEQQQPETLHARGSFQLASAGLPRARCPLPWSTSSRWCTPSWWAWTHSAAK